LSHRSCIFLLFAFSTVSLFGQGAHIMSIGDSLGEGDQSDNAFTLSQQQNYVNYIAKQAQVPLALPLIQSGKLGVVGSVSGRSRTNASLNPDDLAVSGAKVHDVRGARKRRTVEMRSRRTGGRQHDLKMPGWIDLGRTPASVLG